MIRKKKMNPLITPTPEQHIVIALHRAWVEFNENNDNPYLCTDTATLPLDPDSKITSAMKNYNLLVFIMREDNFVDVNFVKTYEIETIYKVSGNCEFIKKFKIGKEKVDNTGGANRITVYIALCRRE